jgi:hypothetical protein
MISMPKPPDPYMTAQAQTGSNIMSSWASGIIGNANERTPYGDVTYSNAGYETAFDPATGQSYQIPRFNRTTTLSPAQQGLLNLQNQAATNLGKTAVQQSDMLKGLLKTPLNTAGLEPWTALPKWNEAAFSADRKRVEDAVMSLWHAQQDPQFAKREATLAARGLTPGSEGYGYLADEQGRQTNDAAMQAILAGGQEQSRLLGEQTNRATFNNQLRGQQFGERQTLQAFPVNLITALMSGSQVNVPQAAPYRAQSIAPAPIADLIEQNFQQRSNNAMAQNQGLFGLAGSVLGGPWMGKMFPALA